MRFQVGDIVRLHKRHPAQARRPMDAIIVEIDLGRATSIAVTGLEVNNRVTNWYPESLRLVRRYR